MKDSENLGAAQSSTPDVAAEAPAKTRPSRVRERLLASALELLYSEGIRATSADRIISDARTTKASFYSHFPTKDHLVLAYLNEQAALERAEMEQAAEAKDPAASIRGVVEHLLSSSCGADFRGCPFINAAAEYPDAQHPVRKLVAEHRAWWRSFFTDLALGNGVPAERATAMSYEMMAFRDGVLLANYLDTAPDLRACAERMINAMQGT